MRIDVRWFWKLKSPVTGKIFTTRWRMTEAEALAQDPNAVRVEGSREELRVAETADEAYLLSPGHGHGFQGPRGLL